MSLFHASRLKIERADQHIQSLHDRTIQFASNCYRLVINQDPQTGNDILEFSLTESLPEDFALIIGDALHNFKSALDLAINEVIFSKLGAYDDFARFPFRSTRSELESAIKGSKITKASPEVADFIVNVIEPYRGGNDVLYSLHQLNILDKHRLLLPVWQVQVVNGIRVENTRGERIFDRDWVITRSHARHELLQRNTYIANYGKATALILFKKGFPVTDEAVIPFFLKLSVAVSSTVEGIASAFV